MTYLYVVLSIMGEDMGREVVVIDVSLDSRVLLPCGELGTQFNACSKQHHLQKVVTHINVGLCTILRHILLNCF